MNGLKQYLLTVIAGALVCVLVQEMAGGKSAGGKLLSLSCGVFLLLCAFSPLIRLDLPRLDSPAAGFRDQAAELVAQAEEKTMQQKNEMIISQVRAYILNEARQLDLTMEVEVTLDALGLPHEVHLVGSTTPFARAKLAAVIARDLGIPAEQQKWSEA